MEHVLNELGVNGVHGVDERAIAGGAVELLLADGAEHEHGVVAGGLPEVTIEAAEEVDGLVVPRPPDVVGDIGENLDRFGKRGHDAERLDSGLVRAQHGSGLGKVKAVGE